MLPLAPGAAAEPFARGAAWCSVPRGPAALARPVPARARTAITPRGTWGAAARREGGAQGSWRWLSPYAALSILSYLPSTIIWGGWRRL